jgi:hypothetical protein
MVIPYLPLPMPRRLSNSSGPVDEFVVASPLVTSSFRSLKIWTPIDVLNEPLVARADRPF